MHKSILAKKYAHAIIAANRSLKHQFLPELKNIYLQTHYSKRKNRHPTNDGFRSKVDLILFNNDKKTFSDLPLYMNLLVNSYITPDPIKRGSYPRHGKRGPKRTGEHLPRSCMFTTLVNAVLSG